MIYKYLGEAHDASCNAVGPRASCLRDGLFRITQPALLNDKTSEFRAAVYFNRFAPADYEWAYEQERKIQANLSYEPSKEELEQLFLQPVGIRYGEDMPNLWIGNEKFRSIEDFDRDQVQEIASRINSTVLGIFSALFGVLSLCEEPDNKLMWTHYGAEGRGIVVGFDEAHECFSGAGLRRVSYDVADRASITYFKGIVRLNGRWMLPERDVSRWLSLMQDKREVRAMMDRFAYVKEPIWAYEQEQRLLIPLSQRDSEVNPSECFRSALDPDVAAFLEPILPLQPKVCLKKIPFSAFKEVLLGYDVSAVSEQRIKEVLAHNRDLRQVVLKRVRVNVFGDLVSHPC